MAAGQAQAARPGQLADDPLRRRFCRHGHTANARHAEALREEVSGRARPAWGCGWQRRRPAWSTSTRASTSSASPSAGCGNGERRSTTSTPRRPGRPSRPSRTRFRPRRTGQPGTRTRRCSSQSINRTLAGWANYHRHGVSKAVFSAVDHHAWGRIMRWLRHKYKQGKLRPRDARTAPPLLRPGTWQFAAQRGRVHRRVSRAGHSATATAAAAYRPPGTPAVSRQPADPAGKTRGAPGAVRAARRVRRAGRGNPPGAILAGRPGPTQLAAKVLVSHHYGPPSRQDPHQDS